MKTRLVSRTILALLALTLLGQLFACNGQPSASSIETAVAGTLAAAPAGDATKVVEITRVKEVTRIIQIEITVTPRPTSQPTNTSAPTDTPTPAPTATPRPPSPGDPTEVIIVQPSGNLGLSLNQLLAQFKAKTDLQKQEYMTTLPGKMVSWTAQVSNVTREGMVELKNIAGGGSVILVGIPTEAAIQLDRNMLVDFTGMIQSFAGNISPEITIVDVTILRAYNLPTPTPTATR